ncbi:S41 family peptidase [Fredinandcohnia humi]
MENTAEKMITPEEINDFINKSITLLQEKYVFPDVAKEIVSLLDKNLKQGKYNSEFSFDKFKELIHADLQSINGDKHLHIWYQEEKLEDTDAVSDEEMQQEYRRVAEKNNYGFHRVERLPGNVGYIDLRAFYDNAIGSETAANAMNTIIHTDALLVDLRKNVGGSPYMVAMLASYFVQEPTHIESFYNRETDSTSQVWTLPHVPGKLYGDKPVYVLTSKKTFSAGEMFSYALKHLGRATVIGENTGGGANPGNYHQVTKHIRLFISSGRSISPFTGTNWEGIGVEPDIKVSADEAYEVAYQKALLDVKQKYQDQKGFAFLVKEAEEELQKLK